MRPPAHSHHNIGYPTDAAGCSSAPSRLDPIESLFRSILNQDRLAFFVPSPVNRGEPVEAVLEISAPTTKPEELQHQLEALAGRVGVGASGSIKISSRMVANLVADRDCGIVRRTRLIRRSD